MRRFPSAGPLPGGPAVPLGGLSSRRDTMRLSRTPGEPSGCYPSPARRRPALLLFGQGAGTQGITPLSGPPPSALNGERGGGVTPRAMAARPRPRHPPRRWRALGRTEEPSWSRRLTQSCLFFCDERSEVSLHLEGARDGRRRGLSATTAMTKKDVPTTTQEGGHTCHGEGKGHKTKHKLTRS